MFLTWPPATGLARDCGHAHDGVILVTRVCRSVLNKAITVISEWKDQMFSVYFPLSDVWCWHNIKHLNKCKIFNYRSSHINPSNSQQNVSDVPESVCQCRSPGRGRGRQAPGTPSPAWHRCMLQESGHNTTHLTWCRTSRTVHHKGRVSARSDSPGPVTNCSWEPQCQSIIIAKVMMMSTPRGGHQFHSTLNTWTHFLTQVIPAAETSNSFLAGQFRSLNDESSLLHLTMARVLCYLSTSLGNFWPSPNVLLCDRSKDMINPNIIML